VFMLPELVHSQPLSKLSPTNTEITLTRKYVASILSAAFFGIIIPQCPKTNRVLRLSRFFSQDQIEPLLCIINYFSCIAEDDFPFHEELVYKLNVLDSNITSVDWAASNKPILHLLGADDKRTEDNPFEDIALVNFAIAYPGGMVHSEGKLLSEEILYLERMELMVNIMLCDKMKDNEAIIVRQVKQYSNCEGQCVNFKFTGKGSMKCNEIVSIDASGAKENKWTYLRDLNKAYSGFMCQTNLPISTGDWGCSELCRDKKSKAVQQIIAASQADRQLYYHSYDDKSFSQEILSLNQSFVQNHLTVGKLFQQEIEGLQ